ncbi:MAG: histidine phosphatase family protein [Halopseudomonas sp.]
MTRVYLVRHGQASFGSANYDQLSELGQLQANLLRQSWQAQGVTIDRVYAGALIRQIQTAQIASGVELSDVAQLAVFDEYPFHQLFELTTPSSATDWRRVSKQTFRESLVALFDQDIDRVLEDAAMLSWSGFRQRCHQGLLELLKSGDQPQTLAVFSSAGVIGAITQALTGSNDAEAARFAFSLYNSAVTELQFDHNTLSLVSFNQTEHLDQSQGLALYSTL